MEVVVIGGSITGLSCAHALLHNSQYRSHNSSHGEEPAPAARVLVLERARSLTAAGAGLGLDADSCAALQSWGLSFLHKTLPLTTEEDRLVYRKQASTVARDEEYNHRAAHWSDLHRILYDALPSDTVLWGLEAISFEESDNGSRVRVLARLSGTSTVREFQADLLIAADGSMSETRKRLMPHGKRRYCGYSAWRGVLDSTTEEGSKVRALLQQQYPCLGRHLYFDIAEKTHAVLYELTRGRVNWVWFVNQPEPILQGSSVTAIADSEMITKMHEDAKEIWTPELASLMQATPAPFINAIFDRDPLEQLVWGRVVLVGEAAHSTSPHAARSTNMSIQDAAVLGNCLYKWGFQIEAALKEYQALRLPVTSQQLLFSRHLGEMKQGFSLHELEHGGCQNAQHEMLLRKNMYTLEAMQTTQA